MMNNTWNNVSACKTMWKILAASALMLAVGAGACSPAAGTDSEELQSVDETVDSNEEAVSGSVPIGSKLRTTANLNFRTGPSTGYKVLRVLPKGTVVTTVQRTSPSNRYYKLEHNGLVGWSHGGYMSIMSTPSGGAAGVTGSVPVGSVLETVTNLNFRTGPSTSYKVLDVLVGGTQVKTVEANAQNKYYKIEHKGMVGWSHGGYMRVVGGGSEPNPSPPPSSAVDEAMARAKAGVGFSYWWGHARWLPSGPSYSTKGSCYGSCPSCSHSGSYGADCSGYLAKIWQVPAGNDDITHDWHPYSTATFYGSSSQWTTVSRSSLEEADALVYRNGGAGHIFLYEKGDGWGSMWAYECKGCSAGCVKNLRTAGSAYKAIRRSGY